MFSLFLMDCFLENVLENCLEASYYEASLPSPIMRNSSFISSVEEEMSRIDDDLESLDSSTGRVRNRQRTRKRLLAKKEKMKVKLHLALREGNQEYITPNERRSLAYYSRKLESDGDFLFRVLCTDLNLTYEDWEPYL